MNFLQSLSIARRTGLVMGLLMTAMVVIAAMALIKFQLLVQSMHELAGKQIERIELSQRWDANLREGVARWQTLSLSPDAALYAQVKDATLRLTPDTTRLQKRFAEIEDSEQGKALGKALGEVRARWLVQREAVRQAIEAGDMATARRLGATTFAEVSRDYLVASARHAGYQLERGRTEGAAAEASAMQQTALLMAVTVACLLGGVVLAVAFVRSLMRPIREALRVAERIAEGDLTVQITATGRDEMARMLAAMHTMQERLRALVGSIGHSAQGLVVASGELAQGNNDLSERTERTAGSLQRAASAMEQIVATVGQTAASARSADQMAAEAGAAARSGGEVVSAVVRTMGEISDASRRIGDIVGTIDSLAFQTNILALNAAVEAARAGEQGRGFAVVATEVRALATRSAEASREIRSLIQKSTGKVDDGARLVEDAGRTIEDLVQRVARVGGMVREISQATGEQSRGLSQISGTVAELDRMTQQNAALVEQGAAASAAMGQQARDLSAQTARFRLLEASAEPAPTGA